MAVSLIVRPETGSDHGAVAAIHQAAFGRAAEAELVERLRATAQPQVSLVAVDHGAVIGHVFFSSVSIHPPRRTPGLHLGLGPMAVAPASQRRGVGARLVRDGLAACRGRGATAVVVLGHPAYYPRFGFVPAARFGLVCEYGGGEAFMAQELVAGALAGGAGEVRYRAEFAAV